jgi:hypothetical protein
MDLCSSLRISHRLSHFLPPGNTMTMQFQQLARAGQITASQAQLLLHQGQLVLNALRTTAAG